MADKKGFHVRLDPEIIREIDHYAVDRDLFRSTAMEQLLRQAIDAHRQGDGVHQPSGRSG